MSLPCGRYHVPRRGHRSPPARGSPLAPWYGPHGRAASRLRRMRARSPAPPPGCAPAHRPARQRRAPAVAAPALRLGRHDLRAGELHQPYPPSSARTRGTGRPHPHRPALPSAALTVGLLAAARFWCLAHPCRRCRFLLTGVWPGRPELTQRLGSPTAPSAAELSFARDERQSRWACSFKGLLTCV